MRSNRKDSFSFSVSKSRLPIMSKSDQSGLMFSFEEGDMPRLKSVTFFGAMTRDECKMLALLIRNGRDFEIKIPCDIDHPGFHGDTLTLTRSELDKHLVDYFGDLDRLPNHCVLSLGKFLEYLRDEILPGLKKPKNRK